MFAKDTLPPEMNNQIELLINNYYSTKTRNTLIPSFYRRYVDNTLPIMPGLDAAESFLDVFNGLHPSIHFTMELSNTTQFLLLECR